MPRRMSTIAVLIHRVIACNPLWLRAFVRFFPIVERLYTTYWLQRYKDKMRNENKKTSLFCFVLFYPYFWLRRKYFRPTNKNKSFYFLFCADLSVLLQLNLQRYVNDYLPRSYFWSRTKSPTRRFPWYQPPAI